MADAQPTVVPNGGVSKVDDEGVVGASRNYFRQLLPDAMNEMKRILKMSSNEKLKAEVARDVIELAGAGGGPKTAQVVINDSQVQLLLQVGREVLGS